MNSIERNEIIQAKWFNFLSVKICSMFLGLQLMYANEISEKFDI